MIVFLWIAFIFVSILLLGVILLQRGDVGGIGAAFGGGGGETAFGVKADVTWRRTTAVLGALFMLLAMAIGILTTRQRGHTVAGEPAPAPAEAPAVPGGGGAAAPAGAPGPAPGADG
ncbi:MAG: hypothetical protein KatS3mg102_1482 [Planctomycetota bacterium]|nr:MAG: hypothetical protein KatS3mg102_1482 [Planctomycetota bacterium]